MAVPPQTCMRFFGELWVTHIEPPPRVAVVFLNWAVLAPRGKRGSYVALMANPRLPEPGTYSLMARRSCAWVVVTALAPRAFLIVAHSAFAPDGVSGKFLVDASLPYSVMTPQMAARSEEFQTLTELAPDGMAAAKQRARSER